MKMTVNRVLSMAAFATVALASANLTAAGVTPTSDSCGSAWAILAPGTPGGQAAVTQVVAQHPHWDKSKYESGAAQSFTLHAFDRESTGGVTVAHCGSGATCNALANAVNKAFPNIGGQVVFCSAEAPYILSNPRDL